MAQGTDVADADATGPRTVPPTSDGPGRPLGAAITDHLRRYGAEASRVVEVFARTHAMHPTDLQALTLIMHAERAGAPATPGDLRRGLNLTSGAVTAAVDRLVAAGHVRREPDARDRRQIRLHRAEAGSALAGAFFRPLAERTNAIMQRYTEDELAVVESFLGATAEAMAHHRASLEQPADPADVRPV